MRLVALVVVAVLAAATVVVPQPVQPVPDVPRPTAAAPFAVCPLAEAAERSTVIALAGGDGGGGELSVFSAGEIVATETFQAEDGGAAAIPIRDVTGLARAPSLIALPDSGMAAETILGGSGSAASACGAGSPETVVMPGGVTSEGETFSVQLANPFAGPATVDVGVASEVGPESDQSLEGVVVPPRSVISVDLTALLPGRLSMAAWVTPVDGRVVASATREGAGDVAAWAGLNPGLDWYLPIPPLEGTSRRLVLAAPGTAEVPFQLDVYGSDGLIEAAFEGTVPARGQIAIQANEFISGSGAVRVLAAAPVAAVVRLESENQRAVIPGVAAPGPTWLAPGVGVAGDSRMFLFNPGTVEVSADISAANRGRLVETVTVAPGGVTAVNVPQRRVGARVDADGNLIVGWVTRSELGLAADSARPPAP